MKLVLAFFLLFFYFQVCAQVVNIENKRIYDDTLGWSGTVDVSFSAQQTRDLLLSLNFRTLAQYKTRKHFLLLLNDFGYSKGDVVYANRGMSHLRYAYRIKNGPWKWESYLQIQYNQLLLQRNRSLAGTGLRWKIYDNKDVRFFTGSSFFFEYEEIQPFTEYNHDVRWSNYLSWFINKPSFAFSAVTYYQANVQDFKDYRLSGQYTFLFKLKKKVDFKVEFSNNFDSRPPQTVRKWIFSSTFGIVLKLG
jgi:hypothetical protein